MAQQSTECCLCGQMFILQNCVLTSICKSSINHVICFALSCGNPEPVRTYYASKPEITSVIRGQMFFSYKQQRLLGELVICQIVNKASKNLCLSQRLQVTEQPEQKRNIRVEWSSQPQTVHLYYLAHALWLIIQVWEKRRLIMKVLCKLLLLSKVEINMNIPVIDYL